MLAVLTMTVGNALALWQDNLRRLLAYSSIANAGYLLIGLAAGLATASATGRWDGIAAMLFYLVVYAAATLGAFAALIYLGRDGKQVETVDELAGLGRTRPAVAATAGGVHVQPGRPAAAGRVVGKVADLRQRAGGADRWRRRLRWWFLAAAVIGVLNAVVAAVYYLRIVAVMYFRAPLAVAKTRGPAAAGLAALACAAVVLALGRLPPAAAAGFASGQPHGPGQIARVRRSPIQS